MSKHTESGCDGCGQVDDHPKNHIYGNWTKNPGARETTIVRDPSFHFDCLPPELVAVYGDAPQHARTVAAIDAAHAGVHGDELRAHIAGLPDDNTIEPEASE